MEKIEKTVSRRQKRWVLAKIGLSSINNLKSVCFLSAIGIIGLVERVKARASTFHGSSQVFVSTVSFDIIIIINGSIFQRSGFQSFLM